MKKQIKSSGILMLEQLFIMVSAFAFTSVCARSLSMSDFGVISVNQYYFTLVGVFLTLSLNAITFQKFSCSENREYSNEVMGSVLVTQLISSVVVTALVILYVLSGSDRQEYIFVTIVLSLANIFKRSELIGVFWKTTDDFNFVLKSRVYARLASLLYVAFVFICDSDSLNLLVLFFLIDSVVYASYVVFVYIKQGYSFKFSLKTSFKLLNSVKSEIPNNIILSLALAFPIVYLERLNGSEAVAPLALALLLLGVMMNLSNAFCDGFYKYVVNLKKNDSEYTTEDLYAVYILISFLLAFLIVLLLYATDIFFIELLFGEKYSGFFYCFFFIGLLLLIVMPSRILFRIVYIESLQSFNKYRIIPASILSIFISLTLIPVYGLNGAIIAIASYYLVGDVIGYFFSKKLRFIGNLFIKSIFTCKGWKSAYMLLQSRSQ